MPSSTAICAANAYFGTVIALSLHKAHPELDIPVDVKQHAIYAAKPSRSSPTSNAMTAVYPGANGAANRHSGPRSSSWTA